MKSLISFLMINFDATVFKDIRLYYFSTINWEQPALFVSNLKFCGILFNIYTVINMYVCSKSAPLAFHTIKETLALASNSPFLIYAVVRRRGFFFVLFCFAIEQDFQLPSNIHPQRYQFAANAAGFHDTPVKMARLWKILDDGFSSSIFVLRLFDNFGRNNLCFWTIF